MQVEKDKVVTIDYTLTDEEGEVLDSSKGGQPLSYIQGHGNVIPGLEDALEGKQPGESFQVTIPPEEAYGERDESLLIAIPRSEFEDIDELAPGMQFEMASDDDEVEIVTVVDIDDEMVTVDAHHPLAGMTLNFDVTVVEVRDATTEEIAHGHAHGPGGVHH